MFGETASIVMACIFSSIGIIYFLYYFIMKLGSFDVDVAIRYSKNSQIFEERSDQLMNNNSSPLLEKDRKGGHNGTSYYFTFIFDGIMEFLSDFLSYQIKVAVILGLLFLFITIFLLEEFIGSFYVTAAYLTGLFYSVMMHSLAHKSGRGALGALIFQSIEGGSEAFDETFQVAYNSALALIVFFLSMTNILMIIMTAIYRSLYVENSNFNEYENMFYLLMGGFTLGYAFVAFFFRVTGTLYHSSVAAAADLIGKTDDEIRSDDYFNPCSMPNQVAIFYKNFMSNFSDITTVFLLLATAVLISTCGSQEFTKEKSTFYFLEVYFGFIILGSMISAVFMKISMFEKTDVVNLGTKSYRLQLLLNHIVTLVLNVFVPLMSFENDFSYNLEDDKLVPGKIINFQMKDMSRGYIILCIFMGYMAEIVLIFTSEYFTSHIYRPVRSMLDKSENGPCLNLFSSTVMSLVTFLVPTFCFFLCFFVSYGTLGYFGVAICAIGLFANLIPVFIINCVASWTEQAVAMVRLSKILVVEEIRNNPLFNIHWCSQNFYMHVRIVTFGAFFLGALALIGCYVNRPIQMVEILTFETLQLVGLFFGSMIPFLLSGVLLAMIQKMLQASFILAKKQFAYFPGIKKGVDKPDFSKIFSQASLSSQIFGFLLFFCNFMIVSFFGLFMGIEGIFGLMMSMILCSSYLIFSAFMNGTALSNSKNFADNNNSVEEFGPIAASVSIGEMFSLLTKEAAPSLMIIIVFNFMLCLLSLRMFDATSWVASGVGLI